METNAPDRNPEVSAQPYLEGDGDAVPWATAVAELAEADTYWLATLHPAGRPHVVPVLAVWVDGVPHVAAAPASRKARNLARVPAVTLTTTGDRWDHVIEGTARPVAAGDLLRRIAGAYLARYGWPVEVRGGALHGEGAPTAGPGPYQVYALTPRRAFGFPRDGRGIPTRWAFR